MPIKVWTDRRGFEYIKINGKVYVSVDNVLDSLHEYLEDLSEKGE
jgi:hypothetical protein